MMSLRTLFIFLVLVNLLFFAWAEGYFGMSDAGREPERLARQLAPEKLKVVGAAAQSGKLPTEACRLIDGLTPEEAQRLRSEAQDKAPGLRLASEPSEEMTRYWVLIPPLPDRAAAEKKLVELKRLGISGYQLLEDEGALNLAIVLGAFNNEKEGNQFLQGLAKRGVRSAKLQAREKMVLKVQLTATGAVESLDEKLRGLLAPFNAAMLSPCAEKH